MGGPYRVAVIGCGRMGQIYVDAYNTYPDTEVVALVDTHAERLQAVGKRFGVEGLYTDVHTMLAQAKADIAAVVTPVKYMKEAVL